MIRSAARRRSAWIAATIFTSALLLFLVQPILSKAILPWFGGSPAVWTTCMLFFQSLLFAGYGYAHASQKLLAPRAQAILHVLLLGAAAAMMPPTPGAAWKPTGEASPTWAILGLLTTSVGLPYFVLSSTGPMLQAWFARAFPGQSPYRLYALSNAGSLLALLSFPFFFEWRFPLGMQIGLWGAGFLVFAVLCVVAAATTGDMKPSSSGSSQPGPADRAAAPVARWQRAAWLLLPALASLMLLATTNHVCQNVAVIPFLWIVPLGLYLISFIIAFDHPRWYPRHAVAVGTMVTLPLVMTMDQLITAGSGITFHLAHELLLHFAGLLLVCLMCHGELVRLRPEPARLTEFYLLIAAGGALGGLAVSVLAPLVFTTFLEWKLALVASSMVAAAILVGEERRAWLVRRAAWLAPAGVLLFAGANMLTNLRGGPAELSVSLRNFYGVTTVRERRGNDPAARILQLYSGSIVHGVQFAAPERRAIPTAYYGRQSGVGRALALLETRPQLRVGIVGLGCGTIASYARPGDSYRFYEINPQVVEMANRHFRFLGECRGTCQVAPGDARVSLEREPSQRFDLLVLDAFSGDSVPIHLLTREALRIYARHLRPDGILAVHVSNRYLDLVPVVRGLAAEIGWECWHFSSTGDAATQTFPAEWSLVSRSEAILSQLRPESDDFGDEPAIVWTDDRANLFEILK